MRPHPAPRMKRTRILALVLPLAVWLGGCATVQARFEPFRGLPTADAEALKAGVFDAPKDRLFDAAVATLQHEPFMHWSIAGLDRANGLVNGDAGLLREVQIVVLDADGGRSRMAVNIPRHALKARAKVYIRRDDPSVLTAYEPAEARLGAYNVVAADAEIDETYFYSFAYRVLHDHSQVPFELRPYGQDGGEAGRPVPLDALPAQAPAATTATAAAEPSATQPAAPAAGATASARSTAAPAPADETPPAAATPGDRP